ncbi:MAG: c-type cytochrome [Chitinophagales bacterium]|nr:c-type cytochrome [Chitinophagales bacterium]
MKKILAAICILAPAILAFTGTYDNGITTLPANPQQQGDAEQGYTYLTTGDFLKSGLPYGAFIATNGKDKNNYLQREGKNATLAHGYNMVEKNGIEMVIPTCLQCHAEEFDGQLVIGLGNTTLDFSKTSHRDVKTRISVLKAMAPKQYEAAEPFLTAFAATYPLLETEVRGINPADGLAAVLAAHRDPKTLEWNDSTMLTLPKAIIPTDVPAWWLMKKKNAMFYTGFGRGDFSKFLMLSNLLTVKDTAEAREVSSHFSDVLAYIRSLQPPAYPKDINQKLAKKGWHIFNDNCSGCHGTYGDNGEYPNLLVPTSIVQTDSVLCNAFIENKPFIDWFNNSWFVQGENPAQLVPFKGYIAPPLDGIWVTAPYMHNGSVPTIEAMLNSSKRPAYWSRDYKNPEYDYVSVGWKYIAHDGPDKKKVYDTTLPGYGNYGHYFGDGLSDEERSAVIEYLKTL